MNLTRKQVHILEILMKGDDDGGLLDMDTLLEKIAYETSKQSMQFSMRILMNKGLVERHYELRRSRKRAVYSLSVTAIRMFDASTGEFDIIEEGLDLDFDPGVI